MDSENMRQHVKSGGKFRFSSRQPIKSTTVNYRYEEAGQKRLREMADASGPIGRFERTANRCERGAGERSYTTLLGAGARQRVCHRGLRLHKCSYEAQPGTWNALPNGDFQAFGVVEVIPEPTHFSLAVINAGCSDCFAFKPRVRTAPTLD